MTLHVLNRRRTYSLAGVPHPSPRLKVLFEDWRRFKRAYDHLLATEPDNEMAIIMLLGDMEPVEKQLALALQRSQPTAAANEPNARERAAASSGKSKAKSKSKKPAASVRSGPRAR
jgi:hypothetical protein